MAMADAYGVKGDGQTDDTQALQRAIDEGGGVLELGKGSYLLSAPLVLDTTQLGTTIGQIPSHIGPRRLTVWVGTVRTSSP